MVNNHNVYILGAGFSFDAGLPLMRDFLNRMRDALDWLTPQPNRSAERDAIERVFAFRKDASAAAYRTILDVENIEELFSLASAAARGQSDYMPLAIAATLDYCETVHRPRSRVLVTAEENAVPAPEVASTPLARVPNPSQTHGVSAGYVAWDCSLHEAYAASMLGLLRPPVVGSRNTFITFNYDLVLERALHAMGRKISYGVSGQQMTCSAPWLDFSSDTRVLKLHGSTNWAYPGGRGQRLTAYDSYHDVWSAGRSPVLVPPTWRKEFVDQLGVVWDAALEALENATRIVVIGFSIPATDVHFRYLMSAGLMSNISLRSIVFVDPAIDVVMPRAMNILRPELVPQRVVQFRPGTASDLLYADFAEMISRKPEGQTNAGLFPVR